MKVKPEQLTSHLKKSLAPIYLVGGDEPLQVQESCDAIRKAAREQGFTEREVMNVERGFDWHDILHAADSMSLFGDRKIIECRLPTGKPGDQGGKVLREYASRPSEDNLLMVVCGKLDGQTLRTKWAKELEQAGVLVQVWPVDATHLPDWISRRLASKGIQASGDAIALLVDRVEGNLLAATQEIDKLLLLHGPGRLEVEAVADAVAESARYNIYSLVDTILQGQAGKTVRMLEGLRAEGVDPVLVLWVLTRELRSLSNMSREMRRGTPVESVLGKERVWERRKPLVRNALKRHGLGRWYGFLQQSAQIDQIIKGQSLGKPWDELVQLSLAVAGKTVISKPVTA